MPKVFPEYKQEAKKRIIKGAMETFFKLGYKKAKMTDIAENLGVSYGAIYQYFKSKEELFFEVFDLVLTQRREKILKSLTNEGLEGIKTGAFFELNLPSPTASINFTMDLLSESITNQRLKEKISQYNNEALTNLESFLETNKNKGLIQKNIDTRKTAIRFFAIREGLKNLLFYGAALSEVKETWKEFTDSLIKEIKTEKEKQQQS